MSLQKRRNVVLAVLGLMILGILAQEALAGVLSIPFFSQRNSRWASNKLGTSPTDTIGNAGCAVSSVAMALRFRGADVDPAKLNRWLTDNGGYVDQDVIRWDVAAGYKSVCGWMSYEGGGSLSSVSQLKAQIDGRRLVIAKSSRTGQHWVIIRGYSGYGTRWSDYLYADPWDQTLTDRRIGDGWVSQGNVTRVYRY